MNKKEENEEKICCLQKNNEKLVNKTIDLQTALAKLETENAWLKNEIEIMTNSTSWRVTRPLRILFGLIRKCVRLPYKTLCSIKNNGFVGTGKKISNHLMQKSIINDEDKKVLSVSSKDQIVILTTKHTLFIAKLIANCMAQIGTPVKILTEEPNVYNDCLHIVITPQMYKKLPRLYISFQMEQTISSRWITSDYYSILEHSYAIFDYSIKNINYFSNNTGFGKMFYYLPVDYLEGMYGEEKKEYDVLFYGDVNNNRRISIIEELRKSFNVKVVSEVFGEELYSELRKAKIIINIHYYENAMLETTRLFECLSVCNAIIISEESSDEIEDSRLSELIDFVPEGNVDLLKSRIHYWLESDKRIEEEISRRNQLLKTRKNQFDYFFFRFLLANDLITFDDFYRLVGKNIEFRTNKICLSLPEQYERRKAFEADNHFGFEFFPGLRHKRGWTGCGLSYKFIMKKALEQGFENIIICEDDVFFPNDFEERFSECSEYLDTLSNWDIFQGLMADIGNADVSKVGYHKDQVFVHLNHMISTVFNYYNRSVFPYFVAWDETNDNVSNNTIDRALSCSSLDVVVVAPFLVGHKEDLTSSIWGFKNTQYNDMINSSSKKLFDLIDQYEHSEKTT